MFRATGVTIAFECDASPAAVADFIDRFPTDCFGINYDIGNSAALGYDCVEEIRLYGSRIVNVHIKDRVRGGTTVPLGTGAADLPLAFSTLESMRYGGRYILQTARALDNDHVGAIRSYRDRVLTWLGEA
jgi:hexulose-6-phosphate isomerase